MNILAIDVGTTSMRGILYSGAGRTLASHSVTTPLLHRNGTIEQAPGCFTGALEEICRAIAAEGRVDALSLTAFRSAVALVDREGRALCDFIMWQDSRNRALCERHRAHNELVFRRSGAEVNTVFTATKVQWLVENRPELCARAHKAVIVPDYLICHMTGELVTDRSYGSRTHLMNIETLQWDEELCALFGVDPRLLCPLVDQGTVVGRVREAFAAATGLAAGTPVVSAGGDQQCGALGLGVLDESALEVNSGTGSFVITLRDRPVLERRSLICNVSAIRGLYSVESNILSCASALNWLVAQFFPEYGGERPDFAAIDRIVEGVPPGANGLLCLPHFAGCGTRDWNPGARAAFWGLGLGSTREEMARALYEGIAAEVARSAQALPGTDTAGVIFVAGGLSRSAVYNQILSDMLEREIVRYDDPQATAIGAFVSAAVELGLYADHRQALAAVREDAGRQRFAPRPPVAEQYRALREAGERLYRSGLLEPFTREEVAGCR